MKLPAKLSKILRRWHTNKYISKSVLCSRICFVINCIAQCQRWLLCLFEFLHNYKWLTSLSCILIQVYNKITLILDIFYICSALNLYRRYIFSCLTASPSDNSERDILNIYSSWMWMSRNMPKSVASGLKGEPWMRKILEERVIISNKKRRNQGKGMNRGRLWKPVSKLREIMARTQAG